MFTIKASGSDRFGIKGARGLLGAIGALRTDLIAARFEALDAVVLKPGEETAVTIAVDALPSNADVKSIRARFDVFEESEESPAETRTVKVTRDAETIEMGVEQKTSLRPSNVTVRLDRGAPIWSFTGTLLENSYELPEFASQLNDYLDQAAPVDGRTVLRFLVKSDTPGRAWIVVTSTDVTRLQTQTWTNDLDESVRLDRNLPLDFGDRWEIPLDPIATIGHPIKRIRIDVAGDFGAERLLGRIEEHAGADFATVGADYAVAQHLRVDVAVRAAGIAGLWAADAETELYVEIQPDRDGMPGADAPLAKSNLTLDAREGVAAWAYAPFDSPVDLAANAPYWIVVKGVRGKARLAIEPASEETYLGALRISRAGRLWKAIAAESAPVSTLRVVHVPDLDHPCGAVQLGIQSVERRVVSPEQAPQTMAFMLESARLPQAVIEITSHARGALSVANVIQEY